MSYSISIEEARKHVPLKTVGRMTVTDKSTEKKRVHRITFGDFLKMCPYKSLMTGGNDGPEYIKDGIYTGYLEHFYHFDMNGCEYEYHICTKHVAVGKDRKKPTYVYPTKITSDYVGGVVYTSNGRKIL